MSVVTAAKLNAIFYPQSVAVVGASTRPGTVGNDIFRNLLFTEFNGSVYPVNPKATQHLRRALPIASLADVPGPVDLAVVIVPAGGDPGRRRPGDRQGRQGPGRHLGRLQGGRRRRARSWSGSSARRSARPASR